MVVAAACVAAAAAAEWRPAECNMSARCAASDGESEARPTGSMRGTESKRKRGRKEEDDDDDTKTDGQVRWWWRKRDTVTERG